VSVTALLALLVTLAPTPSPLALP